MKKSFLLAFMIGAGLSTAYGQVPESDSLALVALYNSTNGDGWTDNSNWLQPGQPVSSWYGIVVHDNRVSQIELLWNNLTGTLPDEIGNITDLQILELYANQISGEIPATIGNLAGLTCLSLRGNHLIGTIPQEIENLINLEYLLLFENQLEGSIPSGIGNLVHLEYILLQNNQLTGPIPDEICNLSNLETLRLNYNQLSDSIPDGIGNLTKLVDLHLDNNNLTGSIPSGIGNLINLVDLCLSANQLTGSIPPEIGNLTKLVYLWLSKNQLTGGIPVELGNLDDLFSFNLCYNQLSGPMPSSLGNLVNLEYLHLHNNQITGSIPLEICNLTKLSHLTLSCNQLSDSIPPCIGNLTNLIDLHLGDNNLTGKIPSEIGNLINLVQLNLSSNQITGSIPPEIGSLNQLSYIYLNHNKLEGRIPDVIRDLPALKTLRLQGNYFNFHDLEPLAGLDIGSFVYHPQGPVPLGIHQINSVTGSDLEIDITNLTLNPSQASNNQYRWWKDGLSITDYAGSPVLSLTGLDITDESQYWCTMTNADFPDLILTTDTFSLVLDGPVDIELTPDSVDENVASGTLVGILVAEDPDQETGHSFAFALGEGINAVDNDSFLIRSDSLFILTSPDYETRQEYHICIRATDDDSKTFDKALVIQVNDIQESDPTGLPAQDMMNHSIKVYPNPASDHVILEFAPVESEHLSAALYDLHGHLIQSFFSQTPMQRGVHVLPLVLHGNIPAGSYVLRISNGLGSRCVRIIKY